MKTSLRISLGSHLVRSWNTSLLLAVYLAMQLRSSNLAM